MTDGQPKYAGLTLRCVAASVVLVIVIVVIIMLFDVYRDSLLKLYYFLRDEPDAFDKSRSYPAARVDFGINMEPLLKKPEVEIDTPPTTFSATNSWNFYEPTKPTVLNM